ncbi:MAG TPA: SRPBCC domain-containing protein, partial [Chryseolinea sp.]|nr:SRPBCC domain-containing protein [Chryseolinea sp.]
MEKQQFKATIAAPREKIWNILWNKDTYPKWTAVFAEGSKAETDWKNVSKILFVDGTGSGMVSRVENVIPNEYMSIEHLG